MCPQKNESKLNYQNNKIPPVSQQEKKVERVEMQKEKNSLLNSVLIIIIHN
jgi:hypothetical protein